MHIKAGASIFLQIHSLYRLNLSDLGSVENFIKQIEITPFKAVLFFASTYDKDKSKPKTFLQQAQLDQQVNAISPAAIARSIKFQNKLGRVFFFGDSGLLHPKPQYMSYSLSKDLLNMVVATTAIDLHEKAISIGINLGPTFAPENADPLAYYSRNLIEGKNVPLGLVRLIDFMINEPNLNMTGTVIDYDGGAYLKRAGS